MKGRPRLPPAELKRRLQERQRAKCAAKRAFISELKGKDPCRDCGVRHHHDVMEFDHCRGEKRFSMSRADSRTWTQIDAEIAKCDLVCANCHRLRTLRRRQAAEIAELTA